MNKRLTEAYRIDGPDLIRTLRHALSLCLVASAFLFTTETLQAGFVNGNFSIDIAESERLLEALVQNRRNEISDQELLQIENQEQCKNPAIRLIDRNRPAILIQNTTDPNGPGGDNEISQFTIDLEQAGFEFGTGDFDPDIFDNGFTYLSSRSDSGISISSSLGTISDTDPTLDPTKLVLDISGLTAGAALIFRLDLDATSPNALLYPDFREVVLGADTGNGVGDPALVSATFAAGTGQDRMTTSTPAIPFSGGMQGQLLTSGILEGYHAQSSADMFSSTGGTEIPEPSSALLLALGSLAGLMRRSRS